MTSISPRTLPILSFNFGTSSEVSSREVVFCRSSPPGPQILGHKSRSPRVHAGTLLDTLLLTRNGPKVLPEGGPPGTDVVHGNRSFDDQDADFVLFGVTVEEIRWLQSGVVVPHVTVRPLRRSRHLRQWARRERPSRTRRCGAPVLSSLRPSSWVLHGHLPSLGFCARRVGDVAPVSRYHLRRSRTTRRGRALLVPRVRPPPPLPCR